MPSRKKAAVANAAGGIADPKQDRSHKDFEPSEDEKTAVKTWLDRVRRAEDEPKRKKWFELLEKLRGYVYGTQHKDDNASDLTRTNLVFATMAAMMPHLYAKNPDIAVTPSKACPKGRLESIKKFGTTSESLLAQMFVKEGKLKRRAKSNVRSTMSTSYGVLKMVYQKDYHGDPITLRRLQDTQDNLARVEALARDLKEGEDVTTIARQRDELQAQLKGLLSGNEIKMFKGFVIDRIRSEDFLVLDDSIAEFDEYVDAAGNGHLVWMTVAAYKAKFGAEPHGATKYNVPYTNKEQSANPEGQTPDEMYVCVVEIWDKEAQVVRTVCKGMNRWCRLPYAPSNTPQRWYPFYVLGFNLVEGRWRPISDVELLMNLQDEYNTTRTNFADVREDAVPVRVFRKGGNLTEDDVKALSVKRRNRDFIGIEGNPNVPLDQDIMQLEGPRIDPQAYDVSMIRNDMDVVVGLSDAGRANLIKPKTATEAEIMNQALGLRVEERRDTNEDMIGDMAEAALEIMLRDLTPEEVKQIAGDDAEWPQMSTEEIFTLVDVSVKAGSSGKPNAQKDREQWTNLLPVITDTMKQVMELRAAGNFDMADSAITLLRETLRRFEERMDVDSLIPPVQVGEDGKPLQQAQQAQAAMQMKQQVEQLQQALTECQAELQKAKEQEAAKVAAENAKAVKAQEDAKLSKDKIDSDERIAKEEIASKERIAADERKDEAAAETAGIARDRARFERELQHKEQLKKIETRSTDEDVAGKDAAKTEAAQRQTAADASTAAMQAVMQSVAEVVGRLEKTLQALAAAADAQAKAAGAESEIVMGKDGMPAGLRKKLPVASQH